MSEKMTVIFVKDTGNVVAALTRAADPEAQLTADILAGESLVLRYVGDPSETGYGETDFLIESDQLNVLIPDFEKDVLSGPRQFWVDRDEKVVPTDAVTTITAAFPNVTQIRITLSAATVEESKVRVEIVGPNPDDRQIVTGTIAAGVATVTINLRPLPASTDHDILTFVQGLAPNFLRLSTP